LGEFNVEDLEIPRRDLAQFSQSPTCLDVADASCPWFLADIAAMGFHIPLPEVIAVDAVRTSRTAHLLTFPRKNSATD